MVGGSYPGWTGISRRFLLLIILVCGAIPARAETLQHTYRFDVSRLHLESPEGLRPSPGLPGSAARLSVPGMSTTWERGLPEMPYDVVTFLVPPGHRIAAVQVRGTAERVLVQDVQLAAALPRRVDTGEWVEPPARPAALAAPTNLYPAVQAEPAGAGALHGYQLASLRVYPLRYARDTGRILVQDRLDLQIETEPTAALPLQRQRFSAAVEESARRQIEGLVVNPNAVDFYARRKGSLVQTERRGFQPTQAPSLEGSPVEQLIITSQALQASFQVLADWKTQRGIPTVVRTVEWIQANTRNGSDLQETLRNFIREAYAQWAVRYVLLGGDTDVLPARYGFSIFGPVTDEHIPTDMYFACLDGNWNADHDAVWGEAAVGANPVDDVDLYAEVFIGRLPVSSTAEAQALIAKIMAYENPASTTYQQRLLFLSEVLFPVDWETGETISQDGAGYSEYDLLPRVDGCTSVTRLYQNHTAYAGAAPLSLAASLAAMNSGYGFVNHIGHGFRYNMSVGDVSLLNHHAMGLTNGDERFVLYMLNCTATAFDFPCLAEAFLDAAGGAVAVMGSSRAAFPLPARNYNIGFFQAMYDAAAPKNIGELFVASRIAYTPNAWTDTSDHYTHYLYNLLADPEMVVHTCSLGTTAAAFPASVGLGTTNVNVTVTVNGAPRADALVCLQKGTEEYVHGRTDNAGLVTLPLRAESAGQFVLTVSGANMTTFVDAIPVDVTGGAYVHVLSLTLDDDAVNGTAGNGDGVLDAGETVGYGILFANDGSSSASNVSGVLRIASPWVSVQDSTYSIGTLAAGGTVSIAGQVRFTVDPATPDGTVLPCTFVSTNGSTTWTDTRNRVVHAPDVQLVLLLVTDPAPGGNGDGTIQAGETFDLVPVFKNYGSGSATGLQATLASLDPDVSLLTSLLAVGNAAPNAECTPGAAFRLLESVLQENLMTLQLTDDKGNNRSWPITLRGPAAPAAPVLDASQGAAIVVSSWTPSVETDLAGYHVYRSTTGTAPWTRVTVDRTAGVAYFRDSALQPSTQYFYYVTAVDSSGNESPPSSIAHINTSPPQLVGWPIQLGAVSSCPPAVGDVTGDGGKEVVAGNDRLYAWDDRGVELLDADNDPQSWGVFSTAVKIVTAAVALAELDPAPGLEIVAAAWGDSDATKVLAFRGDGSLLPGWPRNPDPTSSPLGYWGAPGTVDVDGDGLAEIFAPAKNGNLYAWHHDGTPVGASPAFKTGLGTWSRCSPTFANVDGDPQPEIVYAAPTGTLHIWNADGSNVPGYPWSLGTSILSSSALGDVNNDGRVDVVLVTENDSLYVIDAARRKRLPGWPVALSVHSESAVSPSPALADFDFDGFLEIVVAHNAQPTSASSVRVYDHTGQLLPGWPRAVDNHTSESSPIVADFSGDGVPDIVFGNEGALIYGWDWQGNPLPGFPLTVGGEVRSTPFADDVDDDGDIDLVFAGWDRNLWIWDFPVPYVRTAAQWPTFKHDPQRTGYYAHTAVSPTDVADEPGPAVPPRPFLAQNVPNPFNPVTRIAYGVPAQAGSEPVPVRLDIFDVRGRLVRALVHGSQAPGSYKALWDGRDGRGRDVQSGIYFYRLRVAGQGLERKMLLLR